MNGQKRGVGGVPLSTMTRVERIGVISANAINSQFTLPTNGGLLPSDRYMHSLLIRVTGRVTNAGANNPTGVQADGLPALINRLWIEGYHRIRGANERFIDLRGPELYQLSRIYSALTPPITGTLNQAASATNDFEFQFMVPFVPLGLPISAQTGWLLDAPNYESLKLTVSWGDDKQIFTGQTSASTFSAYGSAIGSPSIEVHGVFAQAGSSRFAGFVPGRIWRYFQETTGSIMTTTATGQRLVNIPRGFRLRHLLFKTGAKSTAVTAGNDVYNTLSDSIIANPTVYRGTNRINRFYTAPAVAKFFQGMLQGIRPDTGYHMIDYVPNGWDGELLDATQLVAGPTGDVDLFYQGDVTGAANQALLLAVEEWRQGPVQAMRRY